VQNATSRVDRPQREAAGDMPLRMAVEVRTASTHPSWASTLIISLAGQQLGQANPSVSLRMPLQSRERSSIVVGGTPVIESSTPWGALKVLAFRPFNPQRTESGFRATFTKEETVAGTKGASAPPLVLEVNMGPAYRAIMQTSCVRKAQK
jgi:hypothetical protein